MTPGPTVVYLVAAALVGGALAHELTHALVAWPLADAVTVDWLEPATYARYDRAPAWAPVVVAVAPLVVGCVVAIGTLLVVGPPTLGDRGVWWLGVGLWTVGGGLDEFRELTLSRSEQSQD